MKIILYIGLAVVGCIILLMVIRFALDKFRGSKGGGSSKGGGGGSTIVIEGGGGGASLVYSASVWHVTVNGQKEDKNPTMEVKR